MWTKTYKVVGFLEPGVVRFGDKGLMIYISKEAIERYSYRLKGKPITIGHIEGITEENAQEVSVGDVAVCPNPGECIVTINNEEADQRISNGERFSCCWVPIKWGPAGTWHNVPYDRELVEMDFTHLAIVPDPRYENVEVFMNSKEYKNKSYRVSDSDQGFSIGPGANPDVTYNPGSATKVRRASLSQSVGTSSKYLSGQGQGSGGRKMVKVSSFQNSLNAGQYAFLKKYIKEWNNAKVDEGLSANQKRDARFERNVSVGRSPNSALHSRISYRGKQGGVSQDVNKSLMQHQYNNETQPSEGNLKGAAKRKAQLAQQSLLGSYSAVKRLGNPPPSSKEPYYSLGTSLKRASYNNEAQPPDNSSERMSRIGAYLQKREDRRMDKQYKTQEAPKQFAERTSTHFSGYKNACGPKFRYKDGKEFKNNVFKEALGRWSGNGRGEKRIDSTRTLLTEQTGEMPKISRGPKGASGKISEAKARYIARDL